MWYQRSGVTHSVLYDIILFFQIFNLWVHIITTEVSKCEWHQTYETVSERNMVQRYLQHCCVVSVRRRIGLHRCLKLHTTLAAATHQGPIHGSIGGQEFGSREQFVFSLGLRLPFPSAFAVWDGCCSIESMMNCRVRKGTGCSEWMETRRHSSRKSRRGRFRGVMSSRELCRRPLSRCSYHPPP